MIWRDAQDYFLTKTSMFLETQEAISIFDKVLEHLTHKRKIDLLADTSTKINTVDLDLIIDELKKEKPIQYILGYEWFNKFQLKVNEYTLIPRPETEELTQWIVNEAKQNQLLKPTIIDIGTGSGCIPIYLKHYLPQATLFATDYNKKTLQVANENADRYEISITFLQDDILHSTIDEHLQFDIIVSNPPYILPTEKTEMSQRVLNYEPHEALFVSNNDALQFYKAILLFAKKHLKNNGFLFFETHQDYALDVVELFTQNGYYAELKKDMHGNDRMVKAVARG